MIDLLRPDLRGSPVLFLKNSQLLNQLVRPLLLGKEKILSELTVRNGLSKLLEHIFPILLSPFLALLKLITPFIVTIRRQLQLTNLLQI